MLLSAKSQTECVLPPSLPAVPPADLDFPDAVYSLAAGSSE